MYVVLKKGVFRKSYDIYPPMLEGTAPLRNYLVAAKLRGENVKHYKKCFKCGTRLDENEICHFGFVGGMGSRTFCEECAKKLTKKMEG